jgi:hypothetical protein
MVIFCFQAFVTIFDSLHEGPIVNLFDLKFDWFIDPKSLGLEYFC